MIAKAMETARKLGAAYLRLFVADINAPAVRMYQKYGFQKAEGVYNQYADEDRVLHEYGYEIRLC